MISYNFSDYSLVAFFRSNCIYNCMVFLSSFVYACVCMCDDLKLQEVGPPKMQHTRPHYSTLSRNFDVSFSRLHHA